MDSLADKVAGYFVAVITGVLLLNVLWQIVISISKDIPEFLKYGITIVIASAIALVAIAKRGIIPLEQITDSDIDLDMENNIQHSYARLNGIITNTNENEAEGSWRYEYNEYHKIYELDIQLVEHIDFNSISRHLETLSSRSGFWMEEETFIHIAEMNESTEDDEYHVYVFAWGNKITFEAAILPDITENEKIYNRIIKLPTSELLDNVKNVIVSSEDIIYGETTSIHFERN